MVDLASVLIVATAFVLGLAHSLDPDHIVAVSALICNTHSLRKSISSAMAWGGGHSIVLIVVGLLLLGLRVAIPDSILQLFELGGGIMLIIIGALVIRPFLTHLIRPNRHEENTENETIQPTGHHNHTHSHGHHHDHHHSHSHKHSHEHDHSHIHKSALTGILQGLGGSAAIMLVTLTTVNSPELGLIFLIVFGIGVILGMVSIACLISSLLNYTSSRLEGVHEKIAAITGTISIGFGIYLITQILLNYHF